MTWTKPEIRILAEPGELQWVAAEEFIRQAGGAVQEKGFFTVALSGGSTPRGLYSLLASEDKASFRGQLAWDKIHFFWGDERHVPPEHPDSNYRMALESMLSRVPVPPENVHRIKAENPRARIAANEYEETLRTFFGLAREQLPRFDLILLGIGPDGHTASIFPGSDALQETNRLVLAPWVEKVHAYRITLTLPVLNNATCIIFLVSGKEKAEAVQAVLQADPLSKRYPARLVCPTQGRLLWLVDRSAARLLGVNY
jgi:6-phosphogluconolactonase